MLDRPAQTDDSAFMAYVPLVAALLDQSGCQSCCDFDDLVYERRRALSVELGRGEVTTAPCSDLVIAIDALDDLDAAQIEDALDEIAALTDRLALIVIRRTLANSSAGDPVCWLLDKVGVRFDLVHFQDCEKGFLVLACAAGQYAKLDGEIDLASLARTTLELAPRETGKNKIRRWARTATQGCEVKWLALWDKRTPVAAKAVVLLACLLALSPIDLTPDFIPRVGFLDDLAFLVLAMMLISKVLSPEVLAEFRERTASMDPARAIRGSFAICSIWIAAIMATALHAMRPVI